MTDDEVETDCAEPEHPWERMAGESSKAYARFCEYRELGADRSLSKLSRSHGDQEGWSRRALEDLSERWRWQARASAWDDEQDQERRRAQAQAAAEMAERQARDGADMQRLARGAMAKWVKQDPDTGQLVLATSLSPADAARLYRLGFEIERTARGEPTIVTDERTGPIRIVEVQVSEDEEPLSG
jgi:hypothetical protein